MGVFQHQSLVWLSEKGGQRGDAAGKVLRRPRSIKQATEYDVRSHSINMLPELTAKRHRATYQPTRTGKWVRTTSGQNESGGKKHAGRSDLDRRVKVSVLPRHFDDLVSLRTETLALLAHLVGHLPPHVRMIRSHQ